jgi:hypothetical protein
LIGSLDERVLDPLRLEGARSLVEILLAGDFEAKAMRGRHLAVAQHQGVMLPLLDAAQIEDPTVGVLDNEAEGLGIEGSATAEVGDTQGDVAAANDVEGGIEDVFWHGHLEAQKTKVSLGRPHSSVRRWGRIFVAGAGVQC